MKTSDHHYGVWANKKNELVLTPRFILHFHCGEGDESAYLFEYFNSDLLHLNLMASAHFKKSSRTATAKIASNIHTGIIKNTTHSFSTEEDRSLVLSYKNKPFEQLNKLESIHCGQNKTLQEANATNIGKCLEEWELGTTLKYNHQETDAKLLLLFNILTREHSYVLAIGDKNNVEFIYCRSAQIKSCNKGTAFAQNIRLMKNHSEYTVKTPEDNYFTLAKPLAIDESLFANDACTLSGDVIYWSLKSFAPTSITLHGCGGNEYITNKPTFDPPEMIEFFL
ncbi:MAG: hypothetical protein HQK52_16860 [Oligoflexia bacterium]|nr:hypothetical protein [Oligoflexia bacterium]